jgi:hypothetical protein
MKMNFLDKWSTGIIGKFTNQMGKSATYAVGSTIWVYLGLK